MTSGYSIIDFLIIYKLEPMHSSESMPNSTLFGFQIDIFFICCLENFESNELDQPWTKEPEYRSQRVESPKHLPAAAAERKDTVEYTRTCLLSRDVRSIQGLCVGAITESAHMEYYC